MPFAVLMTDDATRDLEELYDYVALHLPAAARDDPATNGGRFQASPIWTRLTRLDAVQVGS
jgi:hypothetical protein